MLDSIMRGSRLINRKLGRNFCRVIGRGWFLGFVAALKNVRENSVRGQKGYLEGPAAKAGSVFALYSAA